MEGVNRAVMKNQMRWSPFIFTFFLFAFAPVSFSDEMVQRLDGKVASANEEQRLLVVDFEHPATGEQYQKKFFLREGAGF